MQKKVKILKKDNTESLSKNIDRRTQDLPKGSTNGCKKTIKTKINMGKQFNKTNNSIINFPNFIKKFEVDQSHFPRFGEECGVFGVSGRKMLLP